MLKEIKREINNYRQDRQHDKALAAYASKYEIPEAERITFTEGSVFHYIMQGIYSYFAKRKTTKNVR